MREKTVGGLTRRESILLPLAVLAAKAAPSSWKSEEVRRFPAAEAVQGVAVDAEHFYAIGNSVIAKYDKKSGKRLAGWECESGKPLIHLDSGVVHNGTISCAHSNYPNLPMVSSIETWDTATMEHSGSHSFGIFNGSATWF